MAKWARRPSGGSLYAYNCTAYASVRLVEGNLVPCHYLTGFHIREDADAVVSLLLSGEPAVMWAELEVKLARLEVERNRALYTLTGIAF